MVYISAVEDAAKIQLENGKTKMVKSKKLQPIRGG